VKKLLTITLSILLSYAVTNAACNCGSTNSASPCTGQSSSITVVAGTPNGGTAVNNVYSWTFTSGGGDARCGQFANGDYWVAPASGQSSVVLTGVTSSSHASLITADDNPVVESLGLLNNADALQNYNAANNIIPNLPIAYSTTTSIVTAIQRNVATEGGCQADNMDACTDSYGVLTVLTSVPENAGSTVLRPNIVGETKELISLSDLDFSRVPSKSFLTGTDTTGLETIRKRWSHHSEVFSVWNAVCTDQQGYCSEGGIGFRSHTMVGGYGASMAVQWYNDLMLLFSDDNTIEEKKPALAAMLSFGNDLYHTIYDSGAYTRTWGTGATQHPGKFMPVALFAALLTDTTKANVLKLAASHVHDTTHSGPLELAQVHSGANGPVWGDILNLTGVNFQGSYWSNLMLSQCYDGAPGTCNVAIGSKTMFDPYGYIDGPPNEPLTSYAGSSLGVQKAFLATMFLLPDVCDIVNYDPLTEYVDRVLATGKKALPDPCVTPDSRENIAVCDPYRNQDCVYYGVTWGPVTPSDINSVCITTPTPPYTQQGRFASLDGIAIGAAYTSTQVEANWATIRGAASSCRTNAPRRLKIKTIIYEP